MTSTTAISQRLIGELADIPDALFSRLRSQLPEAVPLHTNAPGRPPVAYDVEALAQLVAQRTAHLTDLACRIRCALGAGRPCRIVEINRKHVLVYDDEPLEELDEATRQAVLDQIHEYNDAASQRRTRRPTEQEQQP